MKGAQIMDVQMIIRHASKFGTDLFISCNMLVHNYHVILGEQMIVRDDVFSYKTRSFKKKEENRILKSQVVEKTQSHTLPILDVPGS